MSAFPPAGTREAPALVPPGGGATLHLSRRALVIGVVALGALWRLFLMGRYAGWEESDYGDLAMIRGVLEARWLHYDMNHLPGYYALGALVLALVGDTVVAAKATSLAGGLVALGLATALADRVFGRATAWIAGLLLVFQPEFALYAASSLREPVYAAAVMACLLALASERLALAGLAAGAAFLIRMDGAMALGPVLLAHALGRAPAPARVARALLPFGATILAWSAYCRWDHGTFLFWSHAVAVNIETGLGAEAEGPLAWWTRGFTVAGALLVVVLPSRIGWSVWAGLAPGLLGAPWRAHGIRRTWSLMAITMAGTWAAMGFTAQHHWDHNLYWKWLHGVIPVVVPVGAAGLVAVLDQLRRRAGRAAALSLGALALGEALRAEGVETARQLALSQQLYAPQVELARWIEREVPEGVPMILDNIPACWIERDPNERPLWSWMDVPTPPGDEGAFAGWLVREGVRYVLWFREDWTEAPRVAPFLAAGGRWARDGVRLEEVAREDAYGWIFYTVTLPGQPTPPAPARR